MNLLLKYFCVYALLITSMSSCIKDQDCSACNETDNNKDLLCVTFNATNPLQTKSNPFPNNLKAFIYAYYSGENPLTKSAYPGTPVLAISNNSNLVLQNDLFVASGTYDFYSVSANKENWEGITFTNGTSDELKNNIDYLWASKKGVQINTNKQITLDFSHQACLININLIADNSSIEELIIKRIRVSLPNPQNSTMDLISGTIRPSNGILGLSDIAYTSNKSSWIMLPLQQGIAIPIEITVDYKMGSQIIKNKIYTTELPPNGFLPGNAYTYHAAIGSTGIVFKNATIEDWKEQQPIVINL